MHVWGYTLASVAVVSLISLVGVFTLSWRPKSVRRLAILLVALATGGLFGDAFIHLIPQSLARLGDGLAASLTVMVGILAFFALEKLLRWRRFHYHSHHVHPIVLMNLVGDGLHNVIDGMLIGASYSVAPALGLSTTIAVVLHEIPQELGDFGVLVHGGISVRRALLLNLLSALGALVGAVAALAVGLSDTRFALYLLPITAGGFIYIAGSDLIPELQHQESSLASSCWQLVLIIVGVGLMTALYLVDSGR